MKKYVLIIGSKPNSNLPIADVEWVFSANGAAEKADFYCKKFNISNHTCVVGTREFEKNIEVSKRVLGANLKEIIFRYGKLSSSNIKLKNNIKLINFSKYEQFNFQKTFFKNSYFDLFYSELSYKSGFLNKLFYFSHCAVQKGFLCSSTGLFSILYALKKFPKHQIIITGIGPAQNINSHFYDDVTNYALRSRVDNVLFNNLKKKYKDRLISTDYQLSKQYNLLEWDKEILIDNEFR